MNDADQYSILASAAPTNSGPADLDAIVAAVKSAIQQPGQDRSQLIGDLGARLLAMPSDCTDPRRIESLLDVSELAYLDGRSGEGLAMVKTAASLAVSGGDVARQRKALTYEAALHGDRGDTPTALESTAGAIVLARQLGNRKSEATLWGNLAALLSQAGDWRGGLRSAERALALDPDSVSALVNAAEACLELGNVVKGLRYVRDCVERSAEGAGGLQHLARLAEAEAICGRLYLEVGEVERATERAVKARAAAERSTVKRALPPVLALEGMCAALSGDRRGGLRLMQRARDMRSPDVGIDHTQRQALRWTARLHRMLGDDDAARAVVNELTETMMSATSEHMRLASGLAGSSAYAVLSDATNHPGVALEAGSVFERFTSIAVSLEEGSGEHGYRVSVLSTHLAADYGCSSAEIEAARQAGLLHDIGKHCVPTAILVKEDPLDEFETSVLRDHPQHGAELLQGAGLPDTVLEGVRHHHERWDGQGFPFRLTGDSIPITARIVGVCEAFDQMIHSTARKREPWTVRRALEELLRERGKRFDPRLVDLLIERVRRLQREYGGVDEALSSTADHSALVIARRRLRELLDSPAKLLAA